MGVDAPLLVPVFVGGFHTLAVAIVRELGLPWPDGVEPTEHETPGDATTMDAHVRTWAHGAVEIVLEQRVDHFRPAMEAPERESHGRVTGLPHGCEIFFSGWHHSTFERCVVAGEPSRVPDVVAAIRRATGAVIRSQDAVGLGVLAPDSWRERAAKIDFTRLDERPHGWIVEDLDATESGWFAVEARGELGGSTLRIDPIGPLPRTLERTRMSVTRKPPCAHQAPPTLESLAEALTGVPLPSEPEATWTRTATSGERMRRFRAGHWILGEHVDPPWRKDDNKTKLVIRIQSERGGPHAFLLKGEYNPLGWGDLLLDILGAEPYRAAARARFEAWAAANDWTVR